MNKNSNSAKSRGFWRATLGLAALGVTVVGAALLTADRSAPKALPKIFASSHTHTEDCLHTDEDANSLKSVLSARAFTPTESCRHLSDGSVIEYHKPHFLEAIAKREPSSATFYSKTGRPIMSVCFDAGTPQEVIDAFMERMQNQPNGAWPDPLSDYQTQSQWGAQGDPFSLTWSLVPDGLSINGYNGEPTSPSDLIVTLDAQFLFQGGRVIWLPRFVEAFERWDELSGINFSRVTAGGGAAWDDGANFDTANSSATRGDIRIGGHPIDGAFNTLAYNFYPGPENGGNMVIDTDDSWSASADGHVRLRNLLTHEVGHGLGMRHVCPGNNTKIMEPILALNFDGPQHDEIRHVQRLYGDATEPNGTPAQAADLGTVILPLVYTGFESVPATVSGINPSNASRVSISKASDVDYIKFTTVASGNFTISVAPIGLTYGDNAQNTGCTQTSTTNSINIANLNLKIFAADGTTLLKQASSNPLGSAEAATVSLMTPATYYIQVSSQGAVNQSQLYGIDLFTNALSFPDPDLISISPTSGIAGASSFILTVNGEDFVPSSVVRWNGSNRSTVFIDGETLEATITAADLAAATTANITVFTGTPGGGTSPGATFTVTNAVPTLTAISPSSVTAGSAAFNLTVNGTGFSAASVVHWDGAPRPTTFVNSNTLSASISASLVTVGSIDAVTVVNPTPGGGISGALNFTTNNPAPATASISPTSAIAGGGAFTLTVNGAGFNSSSKVRWNGVDRTTIFMSPTQLTASIPASDIATTGTDSVSVFNPSPGGGTSGVQTFTTNNPVPTTTSISPSSALVGGPAFTLTVNGTGFNSSSTVRWNGVDRTTTFVSATQVTAAIPATDIASTGTDLVTVFNPTPGGGTSGAQTFTTNNPDPTITTLSPNFIIAGAGAFTLTVNGTGFNSSSKVRWNGVDRATTFVSATQLTASISAADVAVPGIQTITVFNPAPGGGSSGNEFFSVSHPVPTATSLSPTSRNVGGPAFTLTVNGTGFYPSSIVRWDGADRVTTYVSSTQLTASILASDIATTGNDSVTVFNPTPGGGTSNALSFVTTNPDPSITSISPSSRTAGSGAFTLTVTGTGFVFSSQVRWNGSNRTTTFVSPNQLTASISAADIANGGTDTVTVFNPAPGGGTSNSRTFTTNNPVPNLTAISPSSALVGGAGFTLTVTGSNFNAQSIVQWNSSNRPTSYVSPTQLSVSISASDIATIGTNSVIVRNPAPGGGISSGLTFTVNNPIPTLASISPSSVFAGGPSFTLTCNGTNFNSTSVVRVDGVDRSTTLVSSSQVTATIQASDILTSGTRAVTVFNPGPGGGSTGTLNLTVIQPTISGTVNLQGWAGDPTIVPITFRIRPVGGAPESQLAEVTVNLDANFGFTFNAPVGPGNYDILADGSIWLQQLLGNVAVTSGSTTGLAFNLIVGDIDGDEAITPSDYGIWAENNGSFVPAGTNGDLDGDEAVTPSDYGLWQLNNGTFGDP